MRYFREDTRSMGLGFGVEASKTMLFLYVRIARWHHEWSWPRG